MATARPDWSTEQLAQFSEAVSRMPDAESALRTAVELAADALESEVAAVVTMEEVLASVGFPQAKVPEEKLVAARGPTAALELPTLGKCAALVARLDADDPRRLLVARTADGFRRDEVQLLRGMARVLSLLLRMLHLLDEERQMREQSERETAERRRAEAAHRTAERRTRLILETAHDAFMSMDHNGRITAWNKAAEATFGWSLEEVLGRPLVDTVVPERYREAHLRGLERFLATGRGPLVGRRIELTAVRRDGHEFPVELTIAPLRVGRTWLFHSFLRDISDRKRAEAQLEQRALQQASVAALGRRALEGMPLPKLMKETTRLLAETLKVEFVELLELRPDEKGFVLQNGFGWQDQLEPGDRFPAGPEWQAGYTIDAAGPVVVDDWRSEARFKPAPGLLQHGVRSGLSLTVKGRERPFGVLGVHTSKLRAFSQDEVDFVEAVANVLADAIERQRVEDEIRHQAMHDPLTDLPNRVLFLDRLRHALVRSQRGSGQVAVLFIDVDNFKAINDSLSHEAGDELLIALAGRLHEVLRRSDTLARFSGDEFVVLCDDGGKTWEAVSVAERIAAALARPFTIGGAEHFVTVSVGIAVADDPSKDADDLIRDADAAMYRSKQRGGGRHEVFDAQMRVRNRERLRLENDLRRAIDRDELGVVYQPVVSIDGREPCGVEALMRWCHPELGPIPPADFIPLAEATGLIVPMGRWILREACRQVGRWSAVHPALRDMRVSVNLSARQLFEPDLADTVSEAIDRGPIRPWNLALEMTESVLMEDTESLLESVQELKGLGVSLVLDDFGTGYSSLSYLKRLPIDQLKIDRSFVAGLEEDEAGAAIVAAVIAMAQALGMSVVAEGVENPVQARRLRAMGCDFAQGYHFAPPLGLEEAERFLLGSTTAGRGPETAPDCVLEPAAEPTKRRD